MTKVEERMAVFYAVLLGMLCMNGVHAVINLVQHSNELEETCQSACELHESKMEMQDDDLCVCTNDFVLKHTPAKVWQKK